ncbi:hypothetical protein K7432_013361 [Basidiobolus ranarum]|uniref:Metallo-beta-lactamase domain-containing protein n=1 Tax=Basidiobolus ranarum TaxID=34480 RepID=A0ABR2VR25_9FUNG
MSSTPAERNEPTAKTIEYLKKVSDNLPPVSHSDFRDAQGFCLAKPRRESIGLHWTFSGWDFESTDEVPLSVNPSLWRQAQLNCAAGLFQVCEKVMQIRGYDISNMTIIDAAEGLIIIDPLAAEETARAGMELYYNTVGYKEVKAIIFTHSHEDHFGGVKGVLPSDYNPDEKKIQIIAPEGFLDHAVSENVYLGNCMSRRAQYMYGPFLPKDPKGLVDAGLGKTVSIGNVTLVSPTLYIKTDGEKHLVAGMEVEFMLAQNTEAPAEMILYFPSVKALCMAEDATHTLHNIYSLRGAEVRDPVAWWKTLDKAIYLYGDKSEVLFAQHHWPTWSTEKIIQFLSSQRDMYKYLNDQTIRLINHGYTMVEIAEMIKLPASLSNEWYNHGYYGTVNHNVKAIYQKYIGWYNSNPADLDPLTPKEGAGKYVEYMGGTERILERATEAYGNGEYRWVAEVLKHVVYTTPAEDPASKDLYQKARNLQADAFEQLGYQAESGPWRNEYLMGAWELRNGVDTSIPSTTVSYDVVLCMTPPMLFDYMGLRLNGPNANGKTIVLNWNFLTEADEKLYLTQLVNCALIHTPVVQSLKPDATLLLRRESLAKILVSQSTIEEELANGAIKIENGGSKEKVIELFSLLDTFTVMFDIITPNPVLSLKN